MKKRIVISGLVVLLTMLGIFSSAMGKKAKGVGENSGLQTEQPQAETIQLSVAQQQKVSSYITKLEKGSKVPGQPGAVGWSSDATVACRELFKIGKPAVPMVIEAAQDKTKDWQARFNLVKITSGMLGGVKGAPITERLTNQELNGLIKILEDTSDNERVRGAVADEFGLIKDKRATEALIRAMKDPSSHVRMCAARSFGAFAFYDERAVMPLIDALNDSDLMVRLVAASSLGELRDRRAVDPLIDLMERDPEARGHAAISLGMIGDEKAIEALTKYGEAEALGKLKAVESLIKLLKHENGMIVGDAAKALGEIKDRRAIEPLKEALKNIKIKDGYEERMIKWALSNLQN